MIQTMKKLTMVVCVVTIMMQVIAIDSVFAEYNKEMERVYGIWGVPNTSDTVTITADTISGEYYTIVDAMDTGKMVYATLSTRDASVKIVSDGKVMNFTVNGVKTRLYKYYRGDDGKFYRQ